MGIDAKKIGVYLWKFIKISAITSYRFFKKDPYVGVILVFVFLLYVFLPFYFIVLVVCSPLIVLIAVTVRVYLKYNRTKTQNVNQVEKKKCDVHPATSVSFIDDDFLILRNTGTAISRQMSRRRNFKDKNKQAGSEKKDDIVALTAKTMELLGLTSRNEGKPKAVLDVSKSGNVDQEEKVVASESWSCADFTSHNDGNVSEAAGAESMEEDDDDEEDMNKAVEWTKDDQKNLINLGISELERNKRLETLIAKRRATKDGGKGPVDTDKIEIASISVSRKNPRNSEDLPGSAPPILLPSRNPFDLPYDPLEEKPNLMGGKFHQEFKAAQLKDMVFCRHESFTLGTSFGLRPKQEQRNSVFGPYFGSAYRESEFPSVARRQDNSFNANRKYSHPDYSTLSLECLEAEQLIETLRIHPSPDLLHKDESQSMKSIDDETNSEYSDDYSEKQSAHEGTSDMQETIEEESGNLSSIDNSNLGKLNEVEDKAEADRNEAAADPSNYITGSSVLDENNPQIPARQSSTATSKMLHSVNETLMSEIMNEGKDKSFKQGEVESQLSTLEDPAPELLATVNESESLPTRDNDGDKDRGEVENQASTIEEPVPELLTTVQESSPGSSKDIEIESRHSSEASQSDKGGSENLIKNSDEMDKAGEP